MQNRGPPYNVSQYPYYLPKLGSKTDSLLHYYSIWSLVQMPKVNFSSVQDFSPREAGNVECVLIAHENVTTGTGNPGVKLTWHEADNENRKVFKTYSLAPKALWSLKRDCIRMGAPVEEMNADDAETDDILEALYGTACTLEFGDPRPYTDKEGNPKLGDNLLGVLDPAL